MVSRNHAVCQRCPLVCCAVESACGPSPDHAGPLHRGHAAPATHPPKVPARPEGRAAHQPQRHVAVCREGAVSPPAGHPAGPGYWPADGHSLCAAHYHLYIHSGYRHSGRAGCCRLRPVQRSGPERGCALTSPYASTSLVLPHCWPLPLGVYFFSRGFKGFYLTLIIMIKF